MTIDKFNTHLDSILDYYSYLKNQTGKKNSVFKDLILGFFIKLINKTFPIILQPFIKKNQSDILVIMTCEQHYTLTKHIWIELEKKYRINYVIENKKSLIKSIFYMPSTCNIPSLLRPFDTFSKLIEYKYKPKLICIFTHYNLLPNFIKINSSSKTIYIPHAIIDSSYLYSNFNFDYYFVFGKSSEINIKNNRDKFGKSKIVKVGSTMIKNIYSEDKPEPNNKIIYFSTYTVGSEEFITRDFNLMISWFKSNPGYKLYIKLHPLEKSDYVKSKTKNINNIKVYDKNIDLESSIDDISLVITNYSVASVEAALRLKPILVINSRLKDKDSDDFRDSDNYLYLEDFFLDRCLNLDDISNGINQIYDNYDYFIEQSKLYAEFHLHNKFNSADVIVKSIEDIFNEKFKV
tara:strand:- start:2180 stop:3394 length:1215 start_codon:yes stop_codon:yes gene_type:complete